MSLNRKVTNYKHIIRIKLSFQSDVICQLKDCPSLKNCPAKRQ